MQLSASVGICAHNEEDTIGQLLDQVVAEDIPLQEIIVVVAGDDSTEEIVRGRKETHGMIQIIAEGEREGQTAAQNRILSAARGDIVLLVDGDGHLEPGSLELLVEQYSGDAILYGREVPVTDGGISGAAIQTFWELHHELSQKNPKFTTQLSLVPADLVDHIPEHVVLDDEYIGLKAREAGYEIRYVPEAVKHHHVKGDLRSHIRHNRKNWAGMFQLREMYSGNLQPIGFKATFYVRKLLSAPPKRKALMVVAGGAEFIAFSLGWYDHIRGRYPRIWAR